MLPFTVAWKASSVTLSFLTCKMQSLTVPTSRYAREHLAQGSTQSSRDGESESHSVVYDSLWSHGLYSPWSSPGQNTGVDSLSLPSPGDLPNPGIEPRSPALRAYSLPAELPGKPKNTGVGSLSLLQGIFLTQELNRGLLHCRWILYQLSYQGN